MQSAALGRLVRPSVIAVIRLGWWAPLPLGLCSVAAGVIAILLPTITALVLVVVMGVATGVFDLIAAFRLRVHIRGTWSLHRGGILSLVFGALALVWMDGEYAIFTGAFLLASALARGAGSATA
jgi:uncharacterized membrane protein HdeD (DUF308 family)